MAKRHALYSIVSGFGAVITVSNYQYLPKRIQDQSNIFNATVKIDAAYDMFEITAKRVKGANPMIIDDYIDSQNDINSSNRTMYDCIFSILHRTDNLTELLKEGGRPLRENEIQLLTITKAKERGEIERGVRQKDDYVPICKYVMKMGYEDAKSLKSQNDTDMGVAFALVGTLGFLALRNLYCTFKSK